MNTASPPSSRPSGRQNPRRARSSRRVYARRRAVAIVLVLAVLAALGYGLSRLGGNDASSAAGTSSSSGAATDGTTATDSTEMTTNGEDPPTSTVSTLPSTTTTSIFSPNLASEELSIEASPEKVDFVITLQDGTTMNGTTPFTGQVPGGNIRVDFSKQGYNPKYKVFSLTDTADFEVWLDPEGQLLESLVRFDCGDQPKQVAFTPDGKELWVTLLAGRGVEIFDPYTGTKLDELKFAAEAVEVIFTKDGKTAFVSEMETAKVYEIDTATRKVRRSFKTKGEYTKFLELSPDEKILWASNWVSSNVSVIDLEAGKVVDLFKTVTWPRGLYCTADGKRLYVAGFKSGELQRFDLATGESTIVYDGDTLRHFVADESRGLLYVDDLILNEVRVVDLATEKVTRLMDTDQRPNTMDLSPDGRLLFISNRGQDYSTERYDIPGPEWGDVLVANAANGEILDAIVGGNQCTGLDVSPDGKYLAFSDFLDHYIRVYTIPDYETLIAGGGGRAQERFDDIKKD